MPSSTPAPPVRTLWKLSSPPAPAVSLFTGKVVDLDRRTTAGFARGAVAIDGLDSFAGSRMVIDFQNENLIARLDGEIVCTVPDLICAVATDTGEPVTTELMRYGLRVTILGFPAPALWTTPEGLAASRPPPLRLRHGLPPPAGSGLAPSHVHRC